MEPQPLHPFNPDERVHRFRLNLPHWQQAGSTYFITFRTADSLPRPLVKQWLADRLLWLKARGLKSAEELHTLSLDEQRRFAKHFIGRIERALDTCTGECLLRRPDLARIVATALTFFHGKRYWLDCAVVMPNHVHALVTPAANERIDKILHTWKSYTATEINRLTGRSGAFWQRESYDHIVRDEHRFESLREYILANPAKANLVAHEYVLITPGGK